MSWRPSFADSRQGRLSSREWLGVAAAAAALHYLALFLSVRIGNFDPAPNFDHIGMMREVLAQGYPNPGRLPPGFSYCLAFKWALTSSVGLPYASAKYFVDIFPVLTACLLGVLLGRALTANRVLAAASGLGLIAAPIYILGVAEELAVIWFMPVFLCSLLIFVVELRRDGGPRGIFFGASGGLMGLATLIRGDPQYIALGLAPFAAWVLLRGRTATPARVALLTAAFLGAQWAVELPWLLWLRRGGQSAASTTPGVYAMYFDGMKRHPGNRVSDWVRDNYRLPERSFRGVIEFNREWLSKDAPALFRLYLRRSLRTWTMSDTGSWDLYIAALHCPWWILSLLGLKRWLGRRPLDAAPVFIVLIVFYFWFIATASVGLARYVAPVYGFLGLLGAAAFLPGLERPRSRAEA